ncbi:hypothetical protein FA13DRAFT_1177957 [Coprinellus micaceus]|uniref:Uncharacterized protein n=1 Tax=Coprinellus micaceus TaxID=71717 RepID=A0A4Y7STW2_COPMI|nr:hypothetical protein FA13DRAFT_1177957 [Coprinellus micaceus]
MTKGEMLDARQIPMPFSSRPRFLLPFSFETPSMPPVSTLFSSSPIPGSLLHCSVYFAPCPAHTFKLPASSRPTRPYVSEIRLCDSLRPISRPLLGSHKSYHRRRRESPDEFDPAEPAHPRYTSIDDAEAVRGADAEAWKNRHRR